jgi:hypothetical protein
MTAETGRMSKRKKSVTFLMVFRDGNRAAIIQVLDIAVIMYEML